MARDVNKFIFIDMLDTWGGYTVGICSLTFFNCLVIFVLFVVFIC